MTETAAGRRFEVRTYTETLTPDAIAALATAGRQPDRVDPEMQARDAFNVTMLRAGFVLDIPSIKRVETQAVVVNALGTDYRPVWPGEEPTGNIHSWTALGFPRAASDANVPVLVVTPTGDGTSVQAAVPAAQQASGGSVRVKHSLGGEVTITAERADGTGIGYHFAQPITDNVSHVELAPGAAVLYVERDQ